MGAPCQAGFVIKQKTAITQQATAPAQPYLLNQLHEGRHSVFQTVKERIAFKMLRKLEGKPADDASILNILSFCFGLLGNVFGILLIGAVVAAAATTGFFLIGSLVLGLASLITGIIGLARGEKQRGLAIAGIVISGGIFIEILVALIAAIILGIIGAVI